MNHCLEDSISFSFLFFYLPEFSRLDISAALLVPHAAYQLLVI